MRVNHANKKYHFLNCAVQSIAVFQAENCSALMGTQCESHGSPSNKYQLEAAIYMQSNPDSLLLYRNLHYFTFLVRFTIFSPINVTYRPKGAKKTIKRTNVVFQDRRQLLPS